MYREDKDQEDHAKHDVIYDHLTVPTEFLKLLIAFMLALHTLFARCNFEMYSAIS